MSKYNHIKSIPIESIPKKEITRAIREWSEGNRALRNLLWACYKNGLMTTGSHAGVGSYVGFEYDKEKINDLSIVLNATISQKESQVLMKPDGGNPLSGPNWYKPDIAIGAETPYKKDGNKFFNSITDAIESKKANSDLNLTPLLTLNDFLIDKITCLLIRIRHTIDDEYIIDIEGPFKDGERFEQLNKILTEAGLEYKKHPEYNRRYWRIKSNNPIELSNELNNIVDYIIKNYNLKIPDTIDEVTAFSSQAHVVRNQCLKEGNMSKFETWLMSEDEKFTKQIEEHSKQK